ncbi:MAG TPA: hypothetical protein VFL80_13665 [Thermoanaerobaculia bacterium]|nr:hypothetical protein [Thermoanaerobaculia bacterium]
MLTWISILAAVVLPLLGWNLYRRFNSNRIMGYNDRRRGTSRLVSRGVFVDGNRTLDVALAVTESTLYYENGDMQASIDLEWVREVEYDTELATGGPVADGKVLRLRSQSQTFEFVIPNEFVARWHAMLPPRGTQAPAAPPMIDPAPSVATS